MGSRIEKEGAECSKDDLWCLWKWNSLRGAGFFTAGNVEQVWSVIIIFFWQLFCYLSKNNILRTLLSNRQCLNLKLKLSLTLQMCPASVSRSFAHILCRWQCIKRHGLHLCVWNSAVRSHPGTDIPPIYLLHHGSRYVFGFLQWVKVHGKKIWLREYKSLKEPFKSKYSVVLSRWHFLAIETHLNFFSPK